MNNTAYLGESDVQNMRQHDGRRTTMAEQRNRSFCSVANNSVILAFSLISELGKPRIKTVLYGLDRVYDLALAIRLFPIPLFVGQCFTLGDKDIRNIPRMSVCQNRLSINGLPTDFSHEITSGHRQTKCSCRVICRLNRSSSGRRIYLLNSTIL